MTTEIMKVGVVTNVGLSRDIRRTNRKHREFVLKFMKFFTEEKFFRNKTPSTYYFFLYSGSLVM
jgi:hypothetical protein